ncbi:MAG: hypothetical protein A2Y14_01475 [Verrucomicrobia bacterium GWF2_51_19]|nr:MAG: hypothetical protein A2Y14_01475 [Verrucomicrobia bacterium GWF2_51_19]
MSHRSEQKERKALKSQAQRLKAALIIGHDGLKPGVLQTLNDLLRRDELVKVKVVGDRNVVSETAKTLAEKSGATLITVVGKAAVFYKARETNHDPI